MLQTETSSPTGLRPWDMLAVVSCAHVGHTVISRIIKFYFIKWEPEHIWHLNINNSDRKTQKDTEIITVE